MDRLPVKVRVGKVLKEFIVRSNGSDTLDVDKSSIIWSLVRPHLACRSRLSQVNNTFPPDETISILLRNIESSNGLFSYAANRLMKLNITYSHYYLTEEGEGAITRHFNKMLNHTFHAYMTGFIAADPTYSITNAITAFCLEYELEVTEQLISTLDKNWYRYRKKHPEKPQSPILV